MHSQVVSSLETRHPNRIRPGKPYTHKHTHTPLTETVGKHWYSTISQRGQSSSVHVSLAAFTQFWRGKGSMGSASEQ